MKTGITSFSILQVDHGLQVDHFLYFFKFMSVFSV